MQWREAKRRRQRQTTQPHALVPPTPHTPPQGAGALLSGHSQARQLQGTGLGEVETPKKKKKHENGRSGISTSKGVIQRIVCPPFHENCSSKLFAQKQPTSRPPTEEPPVHAPPPPRLPGSRGLERPPHPPLLLEHAPCLVPHEVTSMRGGGGPVRVCWATDGCACAEGAGPPDRWLIVI